MAKVEVVCAVLFREDMGRIPFGYRCPVCDQYLGKSLDSIGYPSYVAFSLCFGYYFVFCNDWIPCIIRSEHDKATGAKTSSSTIPIVNVSQSPPARKPLP